METLQELDDVYVFQNFIRVDSSIEWAQDNSVPVVAYKKSSRSAKEYMETNFVTYNEASNNMIELVICNNDGMAEGVVAALQDKGYNKDGGHVVPVFGVDATENAVALINEGAMIGTVKQDAEGMAAAIANTAKAIAGGTTPVAALAGLKDERFSVAKDCESKLFVAYAPYTK